MNKTSYVMEFIEHENKLKIDITEIIFKDFISDL